MNKINQDVLIDSATDIAIIATDINGIINVFNRGAEDLLGYLGKDVIGNYSPIQFLDEDELQQNAFLFSTRVGEKLSGFDAIKSAVLTDNYDTKEWHFIHKDGDRIALQLAITPIQSEEEDSNGFLFMASKLTIPKTIDDITELPDQHVFDIVADREVKRMQRVKEPLSLLYLSIDHFDVYEEHYGADTVSDLLRTVGLKLHERVQRAGDLLVYLGGPTFSVLLPNTDKPGAVKLSEQLRLLINDCQLKYNGVDPNQVTLSIGVANVSADDESTIEGLVNLADNGMKKALRDGGNCSRLGDYD